MSPSEPIEESIKKLRYETSEPTDKSILADASAQLEQTVGIKQSGGFKRRLTKIIGLGAAAALIIVILVFTGYLKRITKTAERQYQDKRITYVEKPEEVKPERKDEDEKDGQERLFAAGLKEAEVLFKAGDVDGLIELLWRGKQQSKLAAVIYLARLGDAETIKKLDKLSERYGREKKDNLYAIAIAAIKERLGQEQAPAVDTAGVFDLSVVNKKTGEPLAGVNLEVRIDKAYSQAVTDRQGRYRIKLGQKEPDYLRITAGAEGFVPMQLVYNKGQNVVEVPDGHTLYLEPATTIGGIIEDNRGRPIEGASVYLLVPGGLDSDVERIAIRNHLEKTDKQGRWRCDIVPAKLDDVSIRLAHPDYVDDEGYGVTEKPPMEKLRDMTGVMVMEKGLGVAGSVFDANNRPIEGASVARGLDRWGTHYADTKTDANGQFSFESCREGEMVLTVQAESYAPQLKEIIVAEDTGPIEFRLEPGQTIRGRVVDVNDVPIAGVRVSADTWRGYRSIKWRSETDSAGYFEWNDAPSDEVLFTFYKAGYMSTRGVGLSASEDEYVIELYPQLRISGRVVDADSNEPVGSFKLVPGTKRQGGDRISWEFRNAAAFSNGRYEYIFTWSYDGHLIRVEAEGYQPSISRIFYDDEGDVRFDFKLKKGERTGGTVYLPDGRPAAGADVIMCTRSRGAYIRDGMLEQKQDSRFVETGPDGRFSLPAETESYLLAVVHNQGYAELTPEQLQQVGRYCFRAVGRRGGRASYR